MCACVSVTSLLHVPPCQRRLRHFPNDKWQNQCNVNMSENPPVDGPDGPRLPSSSRLHISMRFQPEISLFRCVLFMCTCQPLASAPHLSQPPRPAASLFVGAVCGRQCCDNIERLHLKWRLASAPTQCDLTSAGQPAHKATMGARGEGGGSRTHATANACLLPERIEW